MSIKYSVERFEPIYIYLFYSFEEIRTITSLLSKTLLEVVQPKSRQYTTSLLHNTLKLLFQVAGNMTVCLNESKAEKELDNMWKGVQKAVSAWIQKYPQLFVSRHGTGLKSDIEVMISYRI